MQHDTAEATCWKDTVKEDKQPCPQPNEVVCLRTIGIDGTADCTTVSAAHVSMITFFSIVIRICFFMVHCIFSVTKVCYRVCIPFSFVNLFPICFLIYPFCVLKDALLKCKRASFDV